MEFEKCKLRDIADVMISGVDKKSNNDETPVRLCNFVDVYRNWAITSSLHDTFMQATAKQIEIDRFLLHKGQVAITKDSETRNDIGIATYIADDFDDVILGYHCALITPNNELVDSKYLNAFLHSNYILRYFELNATGSGMRYTLSNDTILNMPILLPSIEQQKAIGRVFSNIDKQIETLNSINRNLEQVTRQLYDYWFVQFDFPNIEGKPYKSSGGELDYIDLLKREIPKSWELVSLNDFVAQRISGDWGNETETTQNSIKVSCIRGADLKTLEDLPTRFIADNHINRLLKPLNVIIEMSGGSPTQSTGRSAIILKETIDDNNNAVVCSNFCQAISPLKEFELYFYFTWQLLYNNNVFFNFEGKTSGLRNLQLDNVLNIKWYKPNIELIKQFNSIGLNYLEETARNKRLIRRLTKLRDELLPMLLNGQVNCDLVYIGITKFHQ